MSEHLSHDQISRWIMGQSTPEEQQHGLECSQCSAELNRFRERISIFRTAMQEWSEREADPKLERIPSALTKPHRAQPALRWALLAMTSVVLIGIPIYEHVTRPAAIGESETNAQIGDPANNDDVLLMESVNAHVSRPIPMPMERVMALLPVEVEQPGSSEGLERKETR